MQISKKTTITLIIVVFFIFIDKFFKTLALKGLLDKQVNLVGDIFSLHFVKNYFIAFSLPFSGLILNITIAIIILALIHWWTKLAFSQGQKEQGMVEKKLIPPLTFLIFGAILNFTDRLKYGYVVDYFDLKYFTVFNVADIMIIFSVIFLIVITVKNKK